MSNILKCKICGGDIEPAGADVAVCLYCGSKQILPKSTSEKKANLYDRANHYRSINEFDKAFAVYEQALTEDTTDAEIYWDLVLCTYGVEYVEDPRTKKRIPTVNRTQFQSIFDDKNYKLAIANASQEQREILKADAAVIDRIQKGILDISNKEQPYDIFICYKETDDSGRRTPDSVLAQDMYKALTEEGYKVFFSRITLEDKLGSAYEPYIFAALNSAKVMIVVGTRPEHFNAVWVKNEWSRYLGLISAGEKKTLIPAYKDMDPYDLPEEFSHLQAQDMGKIGFMQDLLRGIEKLLRTSNTSQVLSLGSIDPEAYKTRIELFLENGDFNSAKEYCDKVLDVLPKDTKTYILKLCAEMNVKSPSELGMLKKSFRDNSSYQNAIKFGTPTEKSELESLLNTCEEGQLAAQKKKKRLIKACCIVAIASITVLVTAFVIISSLALNSELSVAEQKAEAEDFNDAYSEIKDIDKAQRKNPELVDYILAGVEYQNGNYVKAIELFGNLPGYKNADSLLLQARYYALRENFDSMDMLEASNELEELVSAGIVDTDGLQKKIDGNVLKGKVEAYYNSENYNTCLSQLKNYKYQFPEEAAEYIEANQSKWYDKAVLLLKDVEKTEKTKNYSAYSDLLRDIRNLFEMCDDSYKDAKNYFAVINAAIGSNNAVLWEHLDDCPAASMMLWDGYGRWFYGTWKTSDGSYYFKLSSDGSEYNLPWFESNNTFFDIDYEGIYYIYDKSDKTYPPDTRKNMYKFEIVNKTQVKVYCYKDSSNYVLYKQ